MGSEGMRLTLGECKRQVLVEMQRLTVGIITINREKWQNLDFLVIQQEVYVRLIL